MAIPGPIKLVIVFTALLLISIAVQTKAGDDISLSRGQSVYVPAYSHIYHGNKEAPFLLTVTLSIRNIDPVHSIRIHSVNYYETQGKLVKSYLEAPGLLNPLESARFIVPEKDRIGGSGANFMVIWSSETPVNAPIIETIMIGAKSGQGISFTSRGQAVQRQTPAPDKP